MPDNSRDHESRIWGRRDQGSKYRGRGIRGIRMVASYYSWLQSRPSCDHVCIGYVLTGSIADNFRRQCMNRRASSTTFPCSGDWNISCRCQYTVFLAVLQRRGHLGTLPTYLFQNCRLILSGLSRRSCLLESRRNCNHQLLVYH